MPSACGQGKSKPLSIRYLTHQMHIPTSVRFLFFSDISFNIYYNFLKNDFSENYNTKINIRMNFSKFQCHFLERGYKNKMVKCRDMPSACGRCEYNSFSQTFRVSHKTDVGTCLWHVIPVISILYTLTTCQRHVPTSVRFLYFCDKTRRKGNFEC